MTESTSSVNPTPAMQPWENTSSPYFLSSGDNPGVSLVVQHLTEDNYNTWSRAILISLNAKTKLGFIDGSIPKPQSSSIVYFKTARDVWVDLQNRFGQGNGPTIFDLRKEISSLVQEDLTINAYYAKFKGLWDEFSNYRTCTCGHQVEECTMSFLMGLNETYAAVRSQILLMEPVPSLSKVLSLLLQDEKREK
ncbi:uncharacterized protein LOC136062281 [Quercus suber]|uniref:uncharacterized protein LOC136062281 n=1 Tax=Quercus suber TaxID=58331 RepID=UPI0032E02FE5